MPRQKKSNSYENLKELIRPGFPQRKTVLCRMGETTVELQVWSTIPPAQAVQMANEIVGAMFLEDSNGQISYQPLIKNYAVVSGILHYFAGIAVDLDLQQIHDLRYGADLFQKVKEAVNPDQLAEIMEAVDAMEKTRCRSLLEKESHPILDLQKRTDDAENKLMFLSDQIEKLASLFGSYSPTQLQSILSAAEKIGQDPQRWVSKLLEK